MNIVERLVEILVNKLLKQMEELSDGIEPESKDIRDVLNNAKTVNKNKEIFLKLQRKQSLLIMLKGI